MSWFSKKNKAERSLAIDIEEGLKHEHKHDKGEGIGLQAWLKKYTNDPMQLSAVFCATNLIANAIAQMPFEVNFIDGSEDHDTYLDHLFDDTAQTKFIFIKNLIKDVIMNGNGYAYINRDKTGTPVSLTYLDYGKCQVYNNPLKFNEIYYRVPEISDGFIRPENMIHVLMHSKDGIIGRGLLDFAEKAIALSNYTEKAAYDYFAGNMRVLGILSTEAARLQKDQRDTIRQAWAQSQLGDGNGIAVLENGMKYQQISSSAKEAQLLDSRIFNIQEISRFFNINPVLLNDLSKANYNTVEQANLEFVTHTLAPYIVMLEEELNRKLVLPKDKGRLHIDIVEEAIIKSDKQSLANYVTTLVKNGIMTMNEGRQMLNLPPVDDEEADKLIIPYTDISQNTVGQTNDTLKTTEQNNEEEQP